MNTDPKAAADEEWTAERVRGIFEGKIFGIRAAQVADLIKASITTEREKAQQCAIEGSGWKIESLQLREQLAESNKQIGIRDRAIDRRNLALDDANKSNHQLREQLAAERRWTKHYMEKAVEKALVDALQLCVNTLRDKRIGTVDYMEGSRIYSNFKVAADKGDAALAKVKDAK